MKHSTRRLVPAFSFIVAVAIVVASCGQLPAGDARQDGTASTATAALTQDAVCIEGDPVCTPTGAHAKHAKYACAVCHAVAGRLSFQRTGPAYGAGQPAPTFDATAKTCSNVACHGMPAQTFSFYTVDGSGEAVLTTVNIAGSAGKTTPSWNTTGAAACTACHGNPPRNGSDGSNVWHSGFHGGQGPSGARNQCQFCHPGSFSPGDGIGTVMVHNGVLDVQATFTSACFNCH